jgi:hypothetical protein
LGELERLDHLVGQREQLVGDFEAERSNLVGCPSYLPAVSILSRWQRATQFPPSIFRVSSPELAV